jgi:glycosyltransferase involved in cell wall biosynthesis
MSGGPERYLFNIQKCFQDNGHEVIPFSIKYAANLGTRFSKYFVSPIGDDQQIYFSQQKRDLTTIVKNLSRVFYSHEVEGSIRKLISQENPEIAYVLHFLRKLSPSVLVGVKKSNIPLVVRISDFLMLCPQSHFCRGGVVCTDCIDKGLYCSVLHKCVKDNYFASLVSFAAAKFHKYKKYFDLIDAFVFTNKFTMEKYIQAGFPRYKSHCFPTFYDNETFKYCSSSSDRKFITFVGRLDSMKGVDVLLKAINEIKDFLFQNSLGVNIIGTGDSYYMKSLQGYANENLSNLSIIFHGGLEGEDIAAVLNQSIVSVVPSIWYENLPNSLIESYACGTPVIASDIGSLAHYVVNGETGYLFKPGSSSDLAEKLTKIIEESRNNTCFQSRSVRFADDNFSKDKHFNDLYSLFTHLIGNR